MPNDIKVCGRCRKFRFCYKGTGVCQAKQVTVRNDDYYKDCKSYRERRCDNA